MNNYKDRVNFFSEISERVTNTKEFFSTSLLESIVRNFELQNVLISYYDLQGRFLSWIKPDGLHLDCEDHPYRSFQANDSIRHVLFQEAVQDQLTYHNVKPRLYKSTDIIASIDYDNSSYIRFLEENFNAHYSVTLAFGMNAYIQIAFFKSLEEGDFTEDEMLLLEEIYVFIANLYSTFKTYEQKEIISKTKNKIIELGERAFFITDNFSHVLSYNQPAKTYLEDVFDKSITGDLHSDERCHWLSMILPSDEIHQHQTQKKIIKNYVFKIYVHNQCYSNGIIDRYYWITISNISDLNERDIIPENLPLTQSEHKVVQLMYQGLTYNAIASELVISYHTVKKHVQNIYIKCNVNSRHELYNWLDRQKNN